jgi:hypothetical protein
MSGPATSAGRAARGNWRVAGWSIAAAVVLVFVLANAHLVYLAFASRPDCVAPRDAGAATYRAASPAC